MAEPLSEILCLKKEVGHAVWKAFSERGKMAFRNAKCASAAIVHACYMALCNLKYRANK